VSPSPRTWRHTWLLQLWHVALAPIGLLGQRAASADTVSRSLTLSEAVRDVRAHGRVTPSIVAASDTSERYAAYVPSAYTPARRWPILLVMDPRGEALPALRRFHDGAERNGYLVLSSYNTASEGPVEPNLRALDAMLADVYSAVPVDTLRIYLAGYSGTARIQWALAASLAPHLAGMIGFAAGLPARPFSLWLRLHDVGHAAFYGGAGTTDFNYDEVRELAGVLDTLPMSHRMTFYGGPHAWAPAMVCGQALDWMELDAMRRGLRPRDDTAIARWRAARFAEARQLADNGRVAEAAEAVGALAVDLRGLDDARDLFRVGDSLAATPAARRQMKQEERAVQWEGHERDRYESFAARVRAAKTPPTLAQSLDALDLREVQHQAADSSDRLRWLAAQRVLAFIAYGTGFHEPRAAITAHNPKLALAWLEIANVIRPDGANVCWERAQALAQLERPADAVAALRCAVASGGVDAQDLIRESAFDPIRADSAFAAFVAELRANPPPADSD
jgi:predicted esterase